MARTLPASQTEPAPAGSLFFGFLGGPISWTLHLLLSYFVVENLCGPLSHTGVRGLVIALTVLFALVSFASAAVGWREWRSEDRTIAEPLSRSDFMARSGLILGLLFGAATIVEGIPIVLLPLC